MKNYELQGNFRSFKVGDQVWLYIPSVEKNTVKKFTRQWVGPYRVIEKIGPLNYRIQSNQGRSLSNIVHINRIKPFIDPRPRYIPDDTENETILDTELPSGISIENLEREK